MLNIPNKQVWLIQMCKHQVCLNNNDNSISHFRLALYNIQRTFICTALLMLRKPWQGGRAHSVDEQAGSETPETRRPVPTMRRLAPALLDQAHVIQSPISMATTDLLAKAHLFPDPLP